MEQKKPNQNRDFVREDMEPLRQPDSSREQTALDTLARYSNSEVEDFQRFILLTNFYHYVEIFAEHCECEVHTGPVLRVAHSKQHGVSIIDYRVGSPMAALLIDVLSYTHPQCVVMLGLCGGLHRKQVVGDFLLPMAAIRDEGASRHYMPSQVPSLPAFMVQKYIAQSLLEHHINFRTGVIHSTDYRMWEFDEDFKKRLQEERATAIDMECSALFTAGFARKVPVGALMLVSDLPLQPGGIKTRASSEAVFEQYTKQHLDLGIEAMKLMHSEMEQGNMNFRRFDF